MSEEKANYHPLFFTGLLLCSGLISPSDGVDDRTYKTPAEMLSFMVVGILVGVASFSILKLAAYYGLLKTSSQNYHE